MRLENPKVTKTSNNIGVNGAIAGNLQGGQIIGCTVSGAEIFGSTVGGIVSTINGTGDNKIIGCVVTNSTITGGTAGGIAGSVQTNVTITGCCFVGNDDAALTGGIVASKGEHANTLNVTACYWSGGPENGVGSNPDHQGVTKVDGTTTWGQAIQDMEQASGRQFETDASGKPTGVKVK